MKKTFFLSFSITLMLVLLLGITPPVGAALNAMNLVSETNTTYTVKYGTYIPKTIGYGGNSYQSLNKNGSLSNVVIFWKCKESYSVNYNWHDYVAIPSNTGLIDGIYTYAATNTVTSENFSIPVNQENFVDQWAYLGWTRGTGGSYSCMVSVGNNNSAATGTQEFWMDAMKYYPSSSTTPPVYTHGFGIWIPQ
jgi:hypothetical protein